MAASARSCPAVPPTGGRPPPRGTGVWARRTLMLLVAAAAVGPPVGEEADDVDGEDEGEGDDAGTTTGGELTTLGVRGPLSVDRVAGETT